MVVQIIPFHNGLLTQAAELLARRHMNDRAALPELPARFEDPQVARKAIEATLNHEKVSGFAALDDDRLVAYLIGNRVIDSQWGRAAWIHSPGCAYANDFGVEIIRDLYACLGEIWVKAGVFYHAILIPITDESLVHAWFSLSFGIEQMHALLNLESFQPTEHNSTTQLEICRAKKGDRRRLADISDLIWATQVKSPVWGAMLPETVSETREGWAGLVDEENVTVWLGMREDETVGVQAYWPAPASDEDLHIPDQCVHLSVAGTRKAYRNQGINTLLTNHGLRQARLQGYHHCETDWRSTNLLSSRFWPRRGFQPVAYRLARRIDKRISWAQGAQTE